MKNEFKGSRMPDYGDDSKYNPAEKGNIDIAANNYASYMKSPTQSMHVYKDDSVYTVIPKVSPFGQDMTEQQSIRLYKKTNSHLGRFVSEGEAYEYTKWLYKTAREIATYFPDEDIVSSSTEPEMNNELNDETKMNRRNFETEIRSGSGIQQKALGQTLRRVGRSVAKFDPDAFDGDGDGIIQEGTQWARPGLPGSPVIASLRSTSKTPLQAPKETVDAAKTSQKFLRKNEPSVTKKLKDVEAASGGKARLVELENKFKTLESLSEKIERLKGNWDGDVAATAMQMNDSLRYTYVIDDIDDYSNFVKSSLSILRADGSRITSWNYWESKDPYSAVNAMIQDPGGFNYEIQFHTKASLASKKKNEPLYRAFKNEVNSSKRKEIFERMKRNAAGVKKPSGSESIGNSVNRDYRISTFNPQSTLLSTRSLRSVSGNGRKAGQILFPPQDGLPLSDRELKKLTRFVDEEWIPAVLAAVFGRRFNHPNPEIRQIHVPGYDGPRPSRDLVVAANNIKNQTEDLRMEIMAAIYENIGSMMKKGDFSFLAWIPVGQDGDTSWWDKKVSQVIGFPEALKFPVGKHPFIKDSRGKMSGVGMERRSLNNTVEDLVKSIKKTLSGVMGRSEAEESGLKMVLEPQWMKDVDGGLLLDDNGNPVPKIDPKTGKQVFKETRVQALSLQAPSGGDDSGEFGDTFGDFDENDPEAPSVSISMGGEGLDEEDVTGNQSGSTIADSNTSSTRIDDAPQMGRFTKLPNLADEKESEELYGRLFDDITGLIIAKNMEVGRKEQLEENIFQHLDAVSPVLSRMIADRIMGGLLKDEFEQRWSNQPGVTRQVIDALYPNDGGSVQAGSDPFRGLSNIFGSSVLSDATNSGKWAQEIGAVRQAFQGAMDRNNGQQVNAIADLAKQFGIPEPGIRLLLEGIVSSRGTYAKRGSTPGVNATQTALSTAMAMLASGKGKNEVLGEMYRILKGKSPGELTSARMGTIRRDVARALGIQPGELVAWLAEKGVNIKSIDDSTFMRRNYLAMHYSQKSIIGTFLAKDMDEEAIPPDGW